MPHSLSWRLELKYKSEDKAKITTINSIILSLIKKIDKKEAMQLDVYFKMISDQLKIDDI